MRVGIAADHAVIAMKKQLTQLLHEFGQEVRDFGSSGLIDFRTGDSCRQKHRCR
jgi:ribose 5-phosphate isomerase RpiB